VVPSKVSDFSPEFTFKPVSSTVGAFTLIGRYSFRGELFPVASGLDRRTGAELGSFSITKGVQAIP
jgi:hypothetical protein